MTVVFANEPNYNLIRESIQQLFDELPPDLRAKYAHEPEQAAGKDKERA